MKLLEWITVIATVALVVTITGAGLLNSSTVAEERGIVNGTVVELQQPPVRYVRVSGNCYGGACAIKDVSTRINGRSVTLLVRVYLVRDWNRNSRFQYDVPVPEGIDEIRFGNKQTVIWRREGDSTGFTQSPDKPGFILHP